MLPPSQRISSQEDKRRCQTGICGFTEAAGRGGREAVTDHRLPHSRCRGEETSPFGGAAGTGELGLFVLTRAPSIKSDQAEPSPTKSPTRAASRLSSQCRKTRTPNQAVPSIDCSGSRPRHKRSTPGCHLPAQRPPSRERGVHEQRSPAFPAGEPSPVLLLAHLSPAIHHGLPLSLRLRGCHPAVTKVEKNEPFKRGRARDVQEHETN